MSIKLWVKNLHLSENKKFNSLRFIVVIFLFITLLISIVFNAVFMVYNPYNAYKYPLNSFDKVEKAMSLSKNKRNVVYIMIDMTNGLDVTSILQSDPSLSAEFSGFTNYQNVISTNYGTNASVPNIFGGYDFNPYYKKYGKYKGISFREYMKKAMNVLISDFGNSNWDISSISNQYYDYDPTESYWYSNWQALESDFAKYNVKSVNAPDFSNLLQNRYPKIYKETNLLEDAYRFDRNFNDISINAYLPHVKIENTSQNKLLMIMNESVHMPFYMDENGLYKKDMKENIRSLYDSTKGFLTWIKLFIQHLKENGIYDQTMIVINSDHGNSLGSMPLEDNSYNRSNINYDDLRKMQAKFGGSFVRHLPTLLIKPYNSSQPIHYDSSNLYTNTDILSFIKEYNKDVVDFNELDKTQDKRYLRNLSDISARNDQYMVSYENETTWEDDYHVYNLPSGLSYLVKNSIFDINNYLVAIDQKDYYNPDELQYWKRIE